MISFGSSSSSGSSKPVQLPTMTPQQQGIMTALGSTIGSGVGGPVPAYPGNMYVPTLPTEANFMNLAGNMQANNVSGYAQALNNVLSGNNTPNFSESDTANYFSNAILPFMRSSYANVTLPGVTEAFAGPGYWGSARATAQANAAANETQLESGTQANLMYQNELMNWQAKMAYANQMAQITPQVLQQGLTDVGTAGNYARMIDQQQVAADYQRWLSGETVNGVTPTQYNPFLQLAFQYLGLTPYTYGQQTNQSSSGFNFGLLSGPAGGAVANAVV